MVGLISFLITTVGICLDDMGSKNIFGCFWHLIPIQFSALDILNAILILNHIPLCGM